MMGPVKAQNSFSRALNSHRLFEPLSLYSRRFSTSSTYLFFFDRLDNRPTLGRPLSTQIIDFTTFFSPSQPPSFSLGSLTTRPPSQELPFSFARPLFLLIAFLPFSLILLQSS